MAGCSGEVRYATLIPANGKWKRAAWDGLSKRRVMVTRRGKATCSAPATTDSTATFLVAKEKIIY